MTNFMTPVWKNLDKMEISPWKIKLIKTDTRINKKSKSLYLLLENKDLVRNHHVQVALLVSAIKYFKNY